MSGFIEFLINYGIHLISAVLAVQNIYTYFKVEKSVGFLITGMLWLTIVLAFLTRPSLVPVYIALGLIVLLVIYVVRYNRKFFTKTNVALKSTAKFSYIAMGILLVGAYIIYPIYS